MSAPRRAYHRRSQCSSSFTLNAPSPDPTDANVVYTAAGYGCAQGLWKSTNGGATWPQMFSQALIKQGTNDIGSIEINPADHLHILVGAHSASTGTPGAAGVWESRDGGRTWTLPQAAGSSNHRAAFLDAKTWIVITQDTGIWRTIDSGATFSAFLKPHGGRGLYRAKTGMFYLDGNNRSLGELRSDVGGRRRHQPGRVHGPGGRRNLHLHGQRQHRDKHGGAGAILLHTRIRRHQLEAIQLVNVERWPMSMTFDDSVVFSFQLERRSLEARGRYLAGR